jgi:hypothetical protein
MDPASPLEGKPLLSQPLHIRKCPAAFLEELYGRVKVYVAPRMLHELFAVIELWEG